MAKIEVHKYNQAYMTPLGMHSYKLKEPTIELFYHPAVYFASAFLTYSIVSAFGYLIQNIEDTKEALESFQILAGGAQVGICSFIVAFQMRKIKILHIKLQEHVDKVSDDEVNDLYLKNELNCRTLTLRIVLYVVFHTLEFTIVIFYAISCMLDGNYDTSHWYLSIKLLFPFQTDSVLGWFFAWFIEINISLGYSIYMTAITSYFVSCFLYICTMCDHFSILMKFINRYTVQNANYDRCTKNRTQIASLLTEAIQLHVKIFEFSDILGDIITGPIFGPLPINAVFTAVSMFNLEQTIGDFDILVFLFDMGCLISACLWPFLFCTFADLTSDKITAIRNDAYGTSWVYFPSNLRKHIAIVIMRSNEDIYFTGLGIVRCTLPAFGDIIRTSLSFYMVYRTIASK